MAKRPTKSTDPMLEIDFILNYKTGLQESRTSKNLAKASPTTSTWFQNMQCGDSAHPVPVYG